MLARARDHRLRGHRAPRRLTDELTRRRRDARRLAEIDELFTQALALDRELAENGLRSHELVGWIDQSLGDPLRDVILANEIDLVVRVSGPRGLRSGRLGGFIVDAAHQGRGLGRAAVLAALELLVEQGSKAGFALSYEAENVTAAGLYTSLGFVPTGERVDDEVVARRPPSGRGA